MRVTLLNEGMDAYNPNDYGNRITIERRINKGGGGGYKLLSYNGDVSQVLCQLSIPIDIYPNWSALFCRYRPADSPTIWTITNNWLCYGLLHADDILRKKGTRKDFTDV